MHLLFVLSTFLTTGSAAALASNVLYAAVADGTVATLNVSGSKLTTVSSIKACGSSPSWLTFTPDLLYCSGEATPGSLTTFKYASSGLSQQAAVSTTGGDVSSAIYANGKFIALVHYGHNSISTYALPITSSSKPNQNLSLAFPGPGPNPRQDTGYPHQVIVDPSGKFIFSPDLGADLVRVFSINDTSGNLTQRMQIKMDPGTGPRHVAFYKASNSDSDPTFVYVASELGNNLSGYRMDLDKTTGTPAFTRIIAPFSTLAPGSKAQNSSFVAEARVYGKTLTISNRGDGSFGTGMDSLTVFSIGSDSMLTNQKLYPSGGNYPRSFEISKDGTMVAVGNQKSHSVVVMKRDAATGAIGDIVGQQTLSGETIDVIWAQ